MDRKIIEIYLREEKGKEEKIIVKKVEESEEAGHMMNILVTLYQIAQELGERKEGEENGKRNGRSI